MTVGPKRVIQLPFSQESLLPHSVQEPLGADQDAELGKGTYAPGVTGCCRRE
jgi:hypothetical protein